MAEKGELQNGIQFDDCSGCDFVVDENLLGTVQENAAAVVPGAPVKNRKTHRFAIEAKPGKLIHASCDRTKQPDGSIRATITLLEEDAPSPA